MKVALQLRIIPGTTVRDKQKWAFDHGVDGIEISAWDYGPEEIPRARKDFENSLVPVSSICDNPTFDLLDPLPEKRRQCMRYIRSYLKLAGDLGAVGQTMVPILGPPRLDDLSPWSDVVTLEKNLLIEQCRELGDIAAAYNTYFLLEPTNHYEQHLLCRLSDGAEIMRRCGHERVGLTSDFFHMYIEEPDIPGALRENALFIRHIHLADSTGLEPGTGDIDFLSAFQVLLETGFDGYMAFNCSVSGDEQGASLKKSIAFIKDTVDRARRPQLTRKGEVTNESGLAAQLNS